VYAIVRYILQSFAGKPFHLVDLGTSAGVLLGLESLRFAPKRRVEAGNKESPATLSFILDLPHRQKPGAWPPNILSTRGVDLRPLDMADPASFAWLEALIWPDQGARLLRLQVARMIAMNTRPHVVAGDALRLAPELVEELSQTGSVLLTLMFSANQIFREGLEGLQRFAHQIEAEAPCYAACVGYFDSGPPSVFVLQLKPAFAEIARGRCGLYGDWIRLESTQQHS
jgi:hypothetical protein